MSWQVTTFTGLGLVLIGGFAWYERSRPTARLVALVAALAALAIAGRLVLAPIPNVVATTDIALITGYALGGAPGFAVGALAAPVSNIWLGQGPWTVWQMAAWGLVGLSGAWLALVTRRRVNRVGLALACAVAGLAYGALLDLYTMVSYGGEQSLDRYLALSSLGIPFNIAHALGNFTIALAAGPALVRMISRYRTRLEFRWHPAGLAPLLVLGVALALATAHPAHARAGRSASSWLIAAQNDDGGFSATPGQPSSPAMTGWAMLGLESAAINPLDVSEAGKTAVGYLRGQVGRLRSVGDLERTILALTGCGLDPHRFAGEDLVAELRARRDRDGSVDGQVNLTAFYALAIDASGGDRAALKRSATWLRRAQNADRGWGIQPQAPSEADSTGAALQGLIAAGAHGGSAHSGAGWLAKSQRAAGGWALGSSGIVNAQSTAWAVQGLAAAGSGSGALRDGQAYLARARGTDGHYRYSASSDQTPIWVTAQVLLAAQGQPFPVPPVARARTPDAGDAQHSGSSSDAAAGSTPGGSSSSSPASQGGAAGSPGGGPPGSTPGSGAASGGGNDDAQADSAVASDGSTARPADSGGAAESPEAAGGTAANTTPAPAAGGPAVAASQDDSGGGTTPILIGIAALLAIVAAGLALRRRGYL